MITSKIMISPREHKNEIIAMLDTFCEILEKRRYVDSNDILNVLIAVDKMSFPKTSEIEYKASKLKNLVVATAILKENEDNNISMNKKVSNIENFINGFSAYKKH